ncbi:MAG: hypothetical protein HW402_1139 [Dehalococcoidales bacterium]|nr:hypothetical protein [Dehalococcoidales bacterium]
MFYEYPMPEITGNTTKALVTLTPAESKRLIAKGVAAMPEVKNALKSGIIIFARGTTNTYVAEEIMQTSSENKAAYDHNIINKAEYSRGIITHGELTSNRRRGTGTDFVLKNGKIWDIRPQEVIPQFTRDDVFFKGANAVDVWGQAGVLCAGADGGTIGYALTSLIARDANLIVPVGLEKMIPSVEDALNVTGVYNYKYSTGSPVVLIPLVKAKVVTEIQALAILFGVSTTMVGAGGIGGSEGAVVLVIEGDESDVDKAFGLIKSIKGEKPVPTPEIILPSGATLNWDAKAIQEAAVRR